MKTGKIKEHLGVKPYDGKHGRVYYHSIKFEGDDITYNIGSKEESADFLKVGQTLTYEVPDTAKPNSIKRVKENPFGGGGAKPFDSIGVTVGNALNNAALLVAHGAVQPQDLEAAARNIVKIALKLKEEFSK